MQDLAGIALRLTVVYLYLLLLLRLSGKRSIGHLSALDFIVALVVGGMLDDMIWAEVPLSNGLVGLTTVGLLHMLLALAAHYSTPFHNLVASLPVAAVKNGRLYKEGMRQERTPDETVLMELRLQGEEKRSEVKQALWEPSGEMSVQKYPQYQPAQKKDKPRLERLFK